MDKQDIETVKAMRAFEYSWNRRALPREDWINESHYDEQRSIEQSSFVSGWLAAKQDQQLKVGDIIETEQGIFKVMSNKLPEDDHGVKPKRNMGVDGE